MEILSGLKSLVLRVMRMRFMVEAVGSLDLWGRGQGRRVQEAGRRDGGMGREAGPPPAAKDDN